MSDHCNTISNECFPAEGEDMGECRCSCGDCLASYHVETCRTCCRPLASPYRVHDDHGRVIQGCVAVDHDGHIHGYESVRWHNRPEAKAIRKATADHLKTILAPKARKRRAA